jgi:hypothetical protein
MDSANAYRIRVFLERLIGNSAWYSWHAEKRGVTKEVSFGTVNRVFSRCSNNPKLVANAAISFAAAKSVKLATGRPRTVCRRQRMGA